MHGVAGEFADWIDFESGGMGNRVYTGLGDDEVYFVVRGTDLAALADAWQVISGANRALRDYAAGRREELASA